MGSMNESRVDSRCPGHSTARRKASICGRPPEVSAMINRDLASSHRGRSCSGEGPGMGARRSRPG